MSLARSAFALIVPWALIHGFYYFIKSPRSQSLLPTVSGISTRRRQGLWNASSTQVVLKNVHLRVQTTVWNAKHDVLTGMLRRRRRIGWFLKLFYDVGCLLGVLGMLVGLGVLVWTSGQAAYVLAHKVLDGPDQPPSIVKRAIVSNVREPILRQEYQSFIKPLVSCHASPRSRQCVTRCSDTRRDCSSYASTAYLGRCFLSSNHP